MKNKTRKNMIFWVLLAVMLVISGGPSGEKQGISLGGAQTVQAAAKYVVARFRNTSGKPSYNSLRIKVKSGSKIRLPAVIRILDGLRRKMLLRLHTQQVKKSS